MIKIKLISVLFILTFSFSFSQINKRDITKEINKSSTKIDSLTKLVEKDDLVKRFAAIDTLFILFKKSKNQKRLIIPEKWKKGQVLDTSIYYSYRLKDSLCFSLYYKKFFDFDKLEKDSTSSIIKRNIKFLKKNKILTYKQLNKKEKVNRIYFQYLISKIITSKKHVFVIDLNESSNGYLTLRQAKLDMSSTYFFKNL